MKGSRGFPIPKENHAFRGFGGRGQIRGQFGFPSVKRTSEDTTGDGKEVWLVLGESVAGDTSSSITVGPTTLPDTAFLWNGSGLTELTTQDINNNGPGFGTPWKQFALNRNAATGKKCVFVQRAKSSSEVFPDGDNNNWSTTGNLYYPAVAAANAALKYLRLSRLKGILMMVGTNDALGAQSLVSIRAAFFDLIARLNTEFRNIPIYMTSIGRTGGSFLPDRVYSVKTIIDDISASVPNVHIVGNLLNWTSWSMIDADNVHLTQPGYNKVGEVFDRYIRNPEPNKMVREVQNIFFNDQSANYAAIKEFVEGCIIDGNWKRTSLDTFMFFHPTDINDKIVGWTNLDYARYQGGITGGGTNYLKSDGIAGTKVSTNVSPSYFRYATQNDFIKFIRTGAVVTAAGTAMNLYTAGGNMILRSSASNVLSYFSNSTTGDSWTGGDTQFQNNTDYAHDRTTSTAFHLWKNGSIVDTGSAASSAPDTTTLCIFASAADSLPGAAEASYCGYAKLSGFNYTAFIARVSTLKSKWV